MTETTSLLRDVGVADNQLPIPALLRPHLCVTVTTMYRWPGIYHHLASHHYGGIPVHAEALDLPFEGCVLDPSRFDRV
jgi:hypothetical protein